MTKDLFLSWELALVKVILFAMLAVALDKPVGSLAGRIALEQSGFGLYTYDMRENRVHALATGPRGGETVTRGVWVDPDGSFRIDQLPVGEYSLMVKASGYQTSYRTGLYVEEGKVTRLPDRIAMALQQPSVNIASNSRVFTSKEAPHFWINATGANRAVVRIYRKDFLQFLEGGRESRIAVGSELNIYRPYGEQIELFQDEEPVATLKRKLEPDEEDWAHAEFKLSGPLPQGDYFAVVEVSGARGQTDRNAAWFSVSDLGLVVKQAPGKTLVRAIDLVTLQPRAGINVDFYERQPGSLSRLGSARSAADGFALFRTPVNAGGDDSFQLLCYAEQGPDRAYGGLSYYRSRSDRYRTYFYTERPVYRLGQTVFFKGISRELGAKGFSRLPAGTRLHLVIEDPDNQKLSEQDVVLNAYGSFHGTVAVPEDGRTGAYQVTITYPDGASDYERFEVAQYRKPEYQVEVIPLAPQVVAGSTVKARVRATYFFGAPVPNARVKYSVYSQVDWEARRNLLPRPAYYDYFDDWRDYDGDYYYYDGDYVEEGYAQTDETGEAVIEVKTKRPQAPSQGPHDTDFMDRRYKIQAEVTDLSRMTVTGSGTVRVTSGNFALVVEPRNYVVVAGQPLEVSVTAVDYLGQPVAGERVNLSMVRWAYDSVKYTYKGEEVAGQATVKTDSDGKATFTFSTRQALPTDTYYVMAEAMDFQDNLIADQSSVWVASRNYPYVREGRAAAAQALAVKPDKPVYLPGETAKVMITAPVTGKEGAEAIVAVEGTDLFDYRVVPLTSTAQLVEVPLARSYAPNVYLTVTLVGKKHELLNQSKMVKVSPRDNFLTIAVETDKQKYKPGEEVLYNVRATTSDGRPAAATELSLQVVDESIYSIRPETAPDIRKFFYNRRPNWVTTSCSFPEQYSGGPDKVEPRVRKDFRDTAAWIPVLVTDSAGMAQARVKLPDNLTTWRATVRGVTAASAVGSAVQKVVATQDLIVRLALPRFFSEGDEGNITAVVHNYTDALQNVDLTLSAGDKFKLGAPLTRTLSVMPEKAQRVDWPVTVVGSGQTTISVKAVGQTAGDAMERTIPLRPLGVTAFSAYSKLLSDDKGSASIPVGAPADASPGTIEYVLSLAASSIGPVLGNFSALIDYPYGCTEQTMSRLMPSVVAMRLHQALGLPLSAADLVRFAKVDREAKRKLREYQHADGGWGWWQFDRSSPYLTALVLEGYHRLSQAGFAAEKQMVDRGIAWMKKALPELHEQLLDPKAADPFHNRLEARTDLCRMIYTLSLYGGDCPPQLRKYVLAERERLAPEALAYAVLAFRKQADDASAAAVYARLVELANRGEGHTNWDHTPELVEKVLGRGASFSDYSYRYTGVETTALALRAVIAMEPDNSDLIEAVKSWILLQRDKNGWQNTKTTAEVFAALLEEELLARGGKQPSFDVSASMGGNELGSFLFDMVTAYEPEKRLTVPVGPAPAELQIEKSGPGRLYVNGLLTFVRHLSPGDRIADKSLPRGIKLSREFFRLEPKVAKSDGSILFKTVPLASSGIKAGETLLMKVKVESPLALPYVILEAPLPSGGEVVADDPRASELTGDSGGDFFSGDWGPWWWTHQDVLDDRIVFFATSLPAGKSEFHTMVRMEMPGSFQLNPLTLEGMYTSLVRGYSPLDSLKVVE